MRRRRTRLFTRSLLLPLLVACSVDPGVDRKVSFPADRSLGELFAIEEVASFSRGPAKLERGDARGEVEVRIPEGYYLHLQVSEEGARDLSPLASLPADALDSISLNNRRIDDDDLAHLSALSELSRLDLGATRVTGAGLAHLRHLEGLEVLSLALAKQFEDGDLRPLEDLPYLSSLNLGRTSVTDAALATIARLPLERLDLYDTAITDDGLRRIGQMTGLVSLNIGKTKIEDDGLASLTELDSLIELSLEGAPIGDGALRYIRELSGLEVIRLSDTDITESGLVGLGLHIDPCGIESNRFDKKRAFPDCF